MKIQQTIPVLICLVIIGCATSAPKDAVTIFVIEGRVLDQMSNFPLEDVRVYFIDTGYDDTFSKQQKPFEIARSNSRGKIAARFNYWWFRKQSAFNNQLQATFDIVLSREPYVDRRLNFKEAELKTDGVAVLVSLKDVYLVRKDE